MSQEETWFVFPDTSFPPNNGIELGQVITKPRYPYARIAPPFIPRPGETNFNSGKRHFTVHKSRGLEGGVSAHVASFLTLGLSVLFRRKVFHKFVIESDTTFLFRPDPKYVTDTVKQLPFENLVKKGKELYMIVGIKVSHKATVTHGDDDKKGGAGKAGAPIGTTGVAVEGHGEHSSTSTMDDENVINRDFVYAYRLQACVKQRGGYQLRPQFVEQSSHGEAGKLYGLPEPKSKIKTEPSSNDDVFGLALANVKEDKVDGGYESVQQLGDSTDKVRGVILKVRAKVPMSIYTTAAMGVIVYAMIAAYIFTSRS